MNDFDQPADIAPDDVSIDDSYRDDARGGGFDRLEAPGGETPGLDELDVEDPERESTASVSLFEGDEGGLELDQRKALVVLLKQRFISGRTHPKEWQALTRNPRPIRARLNDQFLELHLDREREIAYKRQVSPEGGGRPFPTLLYDAPWGREDTILLVFLRTRFRSEQAAGADRVFVDRLDMLEYVAQHRPAHATDQAGDARRAARAIDTLYSAGLLVGRSDADRFEVSNAIEVLLPMFKLQHLLTWLREHNGSTNTDTGTGAGADTSAEPGGVAADENES
ncbi:DUF4194 domain-containing protein [Modestobacter sp. VKM Ac-2984]|uniref:DUF4194 domain-containing protein n=1 Tax=Modestobacter sp. VKM Ac-2984 TaxID=3004138 RepID=UPI0022AA4AFF|nr:DUF4194 domain-containing protein [Modestobacter sp. VKM Ac-2984]MCZ2818032.1 DUF4194 domain-containing protein [Modestobacter sp. VKM Ac-2984]